MYILYVGDKVWAANNQAGMLVCPSVILEGK